MAKRKTKRKKPAKKTNELAKKDKPNGCESLQSATHEIKTFDVQKRHITEATLLPIPIVGSEVFTHEQKAVIMRKLEAVKAAVRSDSKSLQDEAIGEILGDLVTGAYQDKLLAYAISSSSAGANSITTEALNKTQRTRQSADMHLLNIIKAVRDIKRPPVNVIVREAGQVNVADQINQADKQVNIAKDQPS